MTEAVTARDRPVAIVTGAGSGIGAATARLLAERGMIVALVGRREERLVEVAHQIEENGGESMVVRADLAEADAPGAVIERVLTRLGRIDVLINDAAGLVARPFDQFTIAEFDEQVATNVRSVFFLIQGCC
jgi:NAD(P)-dependent dehydrogenase (short-subunit alcohol dehydrogenase family)